MPKFEDDGISALLTDFSTKLKDIEEKHNLLKERTELLNRTFLKEGKRIGGEISLIKSSLSEINANTENIKESLRSIISESAGFARKEELAILERYMRLWEPLKFAREEDVKRMIGEALKGENRT